MPTFKIQAQNIKSAKKNEKVSETGMAERKQAAWRPRKKRAFPSRLIPHGNVRGPIT